MPLSYVLDTARTPAALWFPVSSMFSTHGKSRSSTSSGSSTGTPPIGTTPDPAREMLAS